MSFALPEGMEVDDNSTGTAGERVEESAFLSDASSFYGGIPLWPRLPVPMIKSLTTCRRRKHQGGVRTTEHSMGPHTVLGIAATISSVDR